MAFLRVFFSLLIEVFGASDEGGSLLHNKPFDYVMARPERSDFRARHDLLSGDLPALAKGGSWYEMVESFGFWGRKFCIKNVEILSVGKIAEFAKFAGGKRRKSPDHYCLIRAAASNRLSSSWQTCFDKRTSAAYC